MGRTEELKKEVKEFSEKGDIRLTQRVAELKGRLEAKKEDIEIVEKWMDKYKDWLNVETIDGLKRKRIVDVLLEKIREE